MKKRTIVITLLIVLLLLGGGVVLSPKFASQSVSHTVASPTPVQKIQTFSYKGEDGKDALMLLKAKTRVGIGSSGMVESIAGRKADTSKHEYWAFYVNGKMAEVGPAAYQTKSTDTIDWRIATY